MKHKAKELKADFELIFSSVGSVTLVDCDNREVLWASDDDQDFAEEFDGDFFDGTDAEEIIEYLEENELIDEDSILDLIEYEDEDEDDIDDEEVIDAEFTPVAKRLPPEDELKPRRPRKKK